MQHKAIWITILVGATALTLAACSTTRNHGTDDNSNDNGKDGLGGGGSTGTYSQGTGENGSGFQPSASCSVPQSNGKTSSYYFEYNKSDIHPEDMTRLQSTASNFSTNHTKLHVVGNTDNRGSREYNIALGWHRANSVATALEQAGVSKAQISTNSNGAEKPISSGSSDSDFQCNRRVDVQEKSGK